MSTLVIGVHGMVSREQAEEMKRRALELLPPGTEVLIVVGCAALAVLEEEDG